MKYAGIVLAVASLLSGLIAAYYWYRATKFDVKTDFGAERLDEFAVNMALWLSTSQIAQGSARLNKIAALWTAVSVALGGTASVMSAINSCD